MSQVSVGSLTMPSGSTGSSKLEYSDSTFTRPSGRRSVRPLPAAISTPVWLWRLPPLDCSTVTVWPMERRSSSSWPAIAKSKRWPRTLALPRGFRRTELASSAVGRPPWLTRFSPLRRSKPSVESNSAKPGPPGIASDCTTAS
ncbi:hypothetical protein [Arenimonas daejeonensis]|uniref:hypothetical protein n=1 Tax=Arenimonas daejeonensis TaxID=370777 RepID=UPI0011BD8421|nr:hypothetical protein [Arenimonas daejeonensis]